MTIRSILYVATVALLVIAFPALSQAQGGITIRLSYKVVLNPTDGNRPMNGLGAVTDADINGAVNAMNTLYRTYFRGYRFEAVEILDIGGKDDTSGPSQWFNTDFFDKENGTAWKNKMEAAAIKDPAYKWRTDAINLYITNGICGGKCSFPGNGNHIVVIGGCSADQGSIQLHEIGHYFDLFHTQGSSCGSCDPSKTGTCHTEPGDDKIPDTLPDLACWGRNNIAMYNFGENYSELTPAQQNQVDNVFLNVMSYHHLNGGAHIQLTEKQLDHWADIANGLRSYVRDGRTIFAQQGFLFSFGSSLFPYGSVTAAVSSAVSSPGADIILLRPGSFNEKITINTAVTLRATRQGAVIIGTAGPPASPE